MNTFAIFRAYLERFLIVWLVLLSWVAYRWPHWCSTAVERGFAFDPFRPTPILLQLMFAVTMLAIGSLLTTAEVRQVYQRWPTVLAGTAIQFTVMPLLAYGVGRLLGLEGPWMIGIVMVGCVPGAMASNVLTLMARGNVSYSVSLTTLATLISPLVVPWVLMLALGRTVTNFPAMKVCLNLCWMVVIPVIVGYALSHRFAGWARAASQCAAVVANLTILWIIAAVVGLNREKLTRFEWRLVGALLLVNVLGYAAGYLGGRAIRLPTGMRRALTLEVGMQNAGLGSTLALVIFADPAVALPPALYTFGCMLTGTVLARLWAELGAMPDASSTAPCEDREPI